MQLKVARNTTSKHTEIVTAVSWSASNELLSVGDDKVAWLWNVEGEPSAKIADKTILSQVSKWFVKKFLVVS